MAFTTKVNLITWKIGSANLIVNCLRYLAYMSRQAICVSTGSGNAAIQRYTMVKIKGRV